MAQRGPQSLTFDEQKAAEAAFRGRPLDPHWPASARTIYQSLLAHTNGRDIVGQAATEYLVADGDSRSRFL